MTPDCSSFEKIGGQFNSSQGELDEIRERASRAFQVAWHGRPTTPPSGDATTALGAVKLPLRLDAKLQLNAVQISSERHESIARWCQPWEGAA
jgi:hypothetical protein